VCVSTRNAIYFWLAGATGLEPGQKTGPGSSPGIPAQAGSASVPPAESFDFLGFTHFGSRSKKGFWVVKRQTAGGRFRRALKKTAAWCQRNRHLPIGEQHQTLEQKLRGHYAYYGGVQGNLRCLRRFRYEVHRVWRQWLSRRSLHGYWTWDRFNAFLRHVPLPWPRAWVSPCAANP
jgi:RNA-directed DNA polymerase